MTMKKKKQLLCEDNLRHNEYYGMQNTIDNLYQASLNGEVFTDLMSVILQRENILLAYRNIKKNTGSKTNGTDNLTIEDIGRCSPDEVVEKIKDSVDCNLYFFGEKVNISAMYGVLIAAISVLIGLYVIINILTIKIKKRRVK